MAPNPHHLPYVQLAVLCLCLVCFTGRAWAGQPDSTASTVEAGDEGAEEGSGMEDVGRVLIVFLVLSVVFEVALTPLFNWRVFMARFENRGVKTPITVILAFIVFWGYGLDIIRDLLVALGKTAEVSVGGQVLTALLIAGGSSGVFQIFTKLQIRPSLDERKEKADAARAALEQKTAAAKAKKPTKP